MKGVEHVCPCSLDKGIGVPLDSSCRAHTSRGESAGWGWILKVVRLTSEGVCKYLGHSCSMMRGNLAQRKLRR